MTDAQSYFTPHSAETGGSEPGTWVDLNTEVPVIEMTPGLRFTPVFSPTMTVNVVRFAPHTDAPLHAHAEEQISLVIEGELEFEVSGETYIMKPFMSVVIPPFAPHGGRTHDQPCVAIDAFHPPREGLLAAMREARARE